MVAFYCAFPNERCTAPLEPIRPETDCAWTLSLLAPQSVCIRLASACSAAPQCLPTSSSSHALASAALSPFVLPRRFVKAAQKLEK